MDKYTVDLDQVLNDFEYLELTDQHSQNISVPSQNSNVLPSTSMTKHSINNVFHSLNEYLNSGITSNTNDLTTNERIHEELKKNDNKLGDNISQTYVVNKDQNISSVSSYNNELRQSENFSESKQVEIVDEEVKLELDKTKEIEHNENNISKESNIENTDQEINNVEIADLLSCDHLIEIPTEKNHVNISLNKTEHKDFLSENIESKTTSELNCIEINVEKDSSVNVTECDKKADKTSVIIENNSADQIANTTGYIKDRIIEKENAEGILVDVDKIESVEKFVIDPTESPYALGASGSQVKNTIFEEFIQQQNVLSLQHHGTISETSLPTNQEQAFFVDLTKDNEADVKLANDENIKEVKQPVSLDNKSDVIEESSRDQSANLPDTKIVGFSADIDIDESELNKMLEDLETEEIISSGNKYEVEKVEKNMLQSEEKEVLEYNVINEETNTVNSLNIDDEYKGNDINSELEASNSKETIHSQSLEVSELTVESSKQNSIKIEENDSRPIQDSPKVEPVESATIMDKPDNTTELNKNIPETILVQGESVVEKQKELVREEQPQDSLTRPHDLPLNNKLKENNIGRKIDLIGSPGSTPYNNVYINQCINSNNMQDSESDCTTSASPTFSDCSTESTSTASTASVEDFPKNVKSQDNTENTNKNSTDLDPEVNESVKNVDSGEGDSAETNQNDTEPGGNDNDGVTSSQGENVTANPQLEDTHRESNIENTSDTAGGDTQSAHTFVDKSWLGKEAPLWIPDADAASCLHCDMKFTVLKRRHHCRACGLVLCSKCCNLKFRLEYLDAEARVCNKCYEILNKDTNSTSSSDHNTPVSGNSPAFRPNPNNPLEYCSTVSPLQQVGQSGNTPPSVMVPVGVLKRKGSNKKSNKSVMFCDGIAPGSDLTNLDQDFNYNPETKVQQPPQCVAEETKDEKPHVIPGGKLSRNQPKINQETGCYIPKSETNLPPTICINKTDILYSECSNSPSVVEMLKNETLIFAINQNLFVHVKVINMNCCINKYAWCFSTEGLINVGSDEIVYLLEYIDEESFVPKDVFFHVYNVYLEAVKGTSVKELGLSLHSTSRFLDSRNHAGFVYIRPSFQCLENVIKPKESFLIGILIHRWETPWAKLFPLRLILRLGAEYRYYPSPIISTRYRDSVFVEVGHTIINLLADFRNFTYSLPQIRGLIIHMEDKKTTIIIPKNRYDQVIKSIHNSSEHILAFAGNFSSEADSHLVCIQDTQGHENCYTTHAINIHNTPRKITGASFIVFNGSLKSSSGLTAKSNIVEDGLMIQIPSEHMEKIREDLRNMKNHTVACGCINATSDETVNIIWGENDMDFNTGVKSPLDSADLKGIPSIRVHNGKDYICNNGSRLIRWTEVFILQNGEENPKNQDPVDISKVSESIAKACCNALVKYLDLLVSNSCQKIGVRTTLHVENVSYSAGSNGLKLPPIYMRSLDNELIPVLHRITSSNLGDNAIVLELIFRILNS